MAGCRHTMRILRGLVPLKTLRQSFTRAIAVGDAKEVDARPFDAIPGPTGVYNIPAIGAMFHFQPFTNFTLENLHLLYNSLLDGHGPLVRVKLGQWTVLVEDLEDIEKVMRHEGKHPDRPLPLIHVWYCEAHGRQKGIGILKGPEWQKLRSAVNAHLLRPQCAVRYLPLQNTVADELVTCMRQGHKSAKDTQDLFFKYACESISAVVFNERLGYLSEAGSHDPEKLMILKNLRQIFQMFNTSFTIPPFILMNFPLKLKAMYKETADNVIQYVERYYQKVLDDLEQQKLNGNVESDGNFVHSMLTTGKLTAQEMGTVALDMFAGGTDSTARAIETFLYNIAKSPDKQKLLYQEILQHVGKDGPVTKEALVNMKYLNACVNESMRLHYPSMTGVQRYIPEDIVLQGYNIPAGTLVSLMNHRVVKNEQYFPNPEAFIPERWLRDTHGKRGTHIPTYALLPFGIGPRQCIGRRFAIQELHLAIIKIIQNFHVALASPEEEVEFIFRIFMGPRHPIDFTFQERHKRV